MDLGVLGVIVGTAAALGLAWGVFRANAKRTSSDLAEQASRLWQQTNEALEGRLKFVELENSELKVKVRILEEKNLVLSDQVTGTSAVHKLSEAMVAQFTEQSRQHTEIMQSINDILRLVGSKREVIT